ncbi:ATP-binding protein [Spirillospora sp. CA-142024]|uniref:ATP-binding protein n=1 Tax=Spirillospora sp. CA-142024 TaxID=3240036 RepID=UPI003D927E25
MNTEEPCLTLPARSSDRPGSFAKITWPVTETRLATVTDTRSWSDEILAGWRNPLREDTALIVTELVTNAILHGGGLHSLQLTLLHDDGVLVEVGDGSQDPPEPREPDPQRASGFGLRLVAALTQDMGQWRHASGKTVWARLGPER